MEKKTHWVFDYIMDENKVKEKNLKPLNNEEKTPRKIEDNTKDKQVFKFSEPLIKMSPSIENKSLFNKPNFRNASLKNKNFQISDSSLPEYGGSLMNKKSLNYKMSKPESIKNKDYNFYNSSYNYNSNLYSPSMSYKNKDNNNNYDIQTGTDQIKKDSVKRKGEKYNSHKNISMKNKVSFENDEQKKNLIELQNITEVPGEKLNNKIYLNERDTTPNKKRVSFSRENQIIQDKVNKNAESEQNLNYIKKTILKKDENLIKFKTNNQMLFNQASLMNSYEKERIEKIINEEFNKIKIDIEDIKNLSKVVISNSPELVDDLRIIIFDNMDNIKTRKNDIEKSLKSF